MAKTNFRAEKNGNVDSSKISAQVNRIHIDVDEWQLFSISDPSRKTKAKENKNNIIHVANLR